MADSSFPKSPTSVPSSSLLPSSSTLPSLPEHATNSWTLATPAARTFSHSPGIRGCMHLAALDPSAAQALLASYRSVVTFSLRHQRRRQAEEYNKRRMALKRRWLSENKKKSSTAMNSGGGYHGTEGSTDAGNAGAAWSPPKLGWMSVCPFIIL
jgi:hypothetical protein